MNTDSIYLGSNFVRVVRVAFRTCAITLHPNTFSISRAKFRTAFSLFHLSADDLLNKSLMELLRTRCVWYCRLMQNSVSLENSGHSQVYPLSDQKKLILRSSNWFSLTSDFAFQKFTKTI